ncbi:lanthionine synthetase LanC family protein [Bifidobacterium saguinibicoloris]|uniref:lanthionine synthetase LanC family protein n=1 Tax=Bifidobacterium saguinibicoloris TaxID=2834433 RepID=UPI001C57DF13|nr:lanthionine synthetase LanC family protein [Bifidobacterium saguinibicoloris]MBW3080447.1 hypothetical protein [Bifidobacterium saguinibicoloris]
MTATTTTPKAERTAAANPAESTATLPGEYADPRYEFARGKAYPTREATSPKDYLEAALRAERFIATRQVEDADGIHWSPDTPGDNPSLTLYAGVAGLAFLYSQLARITSQGEYDRIAIKAGHYLALHWRDIIDKRTLTLTHDTSNFPSYEEGYGSGVGGAGAILLYLAEHYRVQEFADAARAVGEYYRDTAVHDGAGAHWTGNTALSFDGGILLYLIRLYESVPEDWVRDLIAEGAAWFLAQGEPVPGPALADGMPGPQGLKYDGFKGIMPYEPLNFSYGTAGAGYLLLLLNDVLGDERYLEAAKACERYLATQFVPQEKGALLPYLLGTRKPFYYLGHCHGPAGTSSFYYKLYEKTGEERYLKVIEDMVDGLESWGAPEHMSKGLWNTPNQCCGTAGLLQLFVDLYAADVNGHRARWKALAERAAAVLLGWEYRHEDGSSDWPVAWERLHPENIGTRIGYSDGTAGVAAALLQLYGVETGTLDWPHGVEDPFPGTL